MAGIGAAAPSSEAAGPGEEHGELLNVLDALAADKSVREVAIDVLKADATVKWHIDREEPLYRVRGGGRAEAAAQPCEGGCGFDPFAWLARLFGADPGSGARPGLDPGAGARDDGEAGSRPDDAGPMKIAPEIGSALSQTAGADPAIESAIGTPALPVGPEPSAALRTEEVVARIWIAPFVDANGVYREAANVRVVLEPAGWRVP